MRGISKFLGLSKAVIFWNTIYTLLFFLLLIINKDFFIFLLVVKSIAVFFLVFLESETFEKKTMIFPMMHLNISSLIIGILYGAVLLGFWVYEKYISRLVLKIDEFNNYLNNK